MSKRSSALPKLSNNNLLIGQKGSGKSLLTMRYVFEYLAAGKRVYLNFDLTGDWPRTAARISLGAKGFNANPHYVDFLAKRIVGQAFRYDDIGDLYKERIPLRPGQEVEDRALMVMDEASIFLNTRTWQERMKRSKEQSGDTLAENRFFVLSRKLGWTLLFITQSKKLIDKQFLEQGGYWIYTRDLSQYGIGGIRIPYQQFLTLYYTAETDHRVAKKFWLRPDYASRHYDSYELISMETGRGLRYQVNPEQYRADVDEAAARRRRAASGVEGVGPSYEEGPRPLPHLLNFDTARSPVSSPDLLQFGAPLVSRLPLNCIRQFCYDVSTGNKNKGAAATTPRKANG